MQLHHMIVNVVVLQDEDSSQYEAVMHNDLQDEAALQDEAVSQGKASSQHEAASSTEKGASCLIS